MLCHVTCVCFYVYVCESFHRVASCDVLLWCDALTLGLGCIIVDQTTPAFSPFLFEVTRETERDPRQPRNQVLLLEENHPAVVSRDMRGGEGGRLGWGKTEVESRINKFNLIYTHTLK